MRVAPREDEQHVDEEAGEHTVKSREGSDAARAHTLMLLGTKEEERAPLLVLIVQPIRDLLDPFVVHF